MFKRDKTEISLATRNTNLEIENEYFGKRQENGNNNGNETCFLFQVQVERANK